MQNAVLLLSNRDRSLIVVIFVYQSISILFVLVFFMMGGSDAFLQVNLCGHATLAAAQYLFAYGVVDSDVIEFLTLSGVLIAKKVLETKISSANDYQNGVIQEGFSIELDFPVVPIAEFNSAEVLSLAISKSLNGASVIEIIQTTTTEDLIVNNPFSSDCH